MTTRPDFITVTHGLRGYFAVRVDAKTMEPVQTGGGSYATAAEVVPEATAWAAAEGLVYIDE